MNMYKIQMQRFTIIGITTVFIDYFVYLALVNIFGFNQIYKGISFIVGAIFSFFFNGFYTFNQDKLGTWELFKFVLVYCISLILNVFTNSSFLKIFSDGSLLPVTFAFIFATLASSTTNFFSMKFFVFKR